MVMHTRCTLAGSELVCTDSRDKTERGLRVIENYPPNFVQDASVRRTDMRIVRRVDEHDEPTVHFYLDIWKYAGTHKNELFYSNCKTKLKDLIYFPCFQPCPLTPFKWSPVLPTVTMKKLDAIYDIRWAKMPKTYLIKARSCKNHTNH